MGHSAIQTTMIYAHFESAAQRREAEALDAQVPNLILQPLVENSIRHAVAVRIEPDTGERLGGLASRTGNARRGWQRRKNAPGGSPPSESTLRPFIDPACAYRSTRQLPGAAGTTRSAR